MTSPQQLRLSPSGPVIGNPPQLVGGNSNVDGRVWVAQGSGAAALVPGTAAGNISGLDAVLVNLLPAYKYDVELDTQTFGDVGTSGGYDLLVLGSSDGGATYPTVLAQIPDSIDRSGCGRLQVTNVSVVNTIDHVRCQIRSLLASGGNFVYSPAASALRITEISSGVVV